MSTDTARLLRTITAEDLDDFITALEDHGIIAWDDDTAVEVLPNYATGPAILVTCVPGSDKTVALGVAIAGNDKLARLARNAEVIGGHGQRNVLFRHVAVIA